MSDWDGSKLFIPTRRKKTTTLEQEEQKITAANTHNENNKQPESSTPVKRTLETTTANGNKRLKSEHSFSDQSSEKDLFANSQEVKVPIESIKSNDSGMKTDATNESNPGKGKDKVQPQNDLKMEQNTQEPVVVKKDPVIVKEEQLQSTNNLLSCPPQAASALANVKGKQKESNSEGNGEKLDLNKLKTEHNNKSGELTTSKLFLDMFSRVINLVLNPKLLEDKVKLETEPAGGKGKIKSDVEKLQRISIAAIHIIDAVMRDYPNGSRLMQGLKSIPSLQALAHVPPQPQNKSGTRSQSDIIADAIQGLADLLPKPVKSTNSPTSTNRLQASIDTLQESLNWLNIPTTIVSAKKPQTPTVPESNKQPQTSTTPNGATLNANQMHPNTPTPPNGQPMLPNGYPIPPNGIPMQPNSNQMPSNGYPPMKEKTPAKMNAPRASSSKTAPLAKIAPAPSKSQETPTNNLSNGNVPVFSANLQAPINQAAKQPALNPPNIPPWPRIDFLRALNVPLPSISQTAKRPPQATASTFKEAPIQASQARAPPPGPSRTAVRPPPAPSRTAVRPPPAPSRTAARPPPAPSRTAVRPSLNSPQATNQTTSQRNAAPSVNNASTARPKATASTSATTPTPPTASTSAATTPVPEKTQQQLLSEAERYFTGPKRERVKRAIKQKMFVLSRSLDPNDDSVEKFEVIGSIGSIYTVTVGINISCTCPDYEDRYTHCKHILMVFIKVYRLPLGDVMYNTLSTTKDRRINARSTGRRVDPSVLIPPNIRRRIANVRQGSTPALPEAKRNEFNHANCPVCYEAFNKAHAVDILYCKTCGSNIHGTCFKTVLKTRGGDAVCMSCNAKWVYENALPSNASLGRPRLDAEHTHEGRANFSKELGLSRIRDTSTYSWGSCDYRRHNRWGFFRGCRDYDDIDDYDSFDEFEDGDDEFYSIFDY